MRTKLYFLALPFLTSATLLADTIALFQPESSTVGPFPSDALTVPDTRQKTGLRVNLPQPPECGSSAGLSACNDTALLNQLDGFSVNPRVIACFSGAIDPGTLPGGIQLIAAAGSEPAIALNQVLYDPAGNCVYAKPDQVLNQQRRYLLIVKATIRDTAGQAIKADQDFNGCATNTSSDPYCGALTQALNQLSPDLKSQVVSASIFTTLSATTWLEKARAMVNFLLTPVAVLPAGLPFTFQVTNLKSITWFPQDNSGNNTQQQLPLTALQNVQTVAFGLYLSPNFLNTSGPAAGSITTTPTNQPIGTTLPVPGLPIVVPQGYVPISFHVFLPPANKLPANGRGFPAVIYGHGLGDSQFGAPTFIASKLAENGIATIAFEIMGHGFGSQSYVRLTNQNNASFYVATPGRGVTLSPSGPIGPTDGCILPGPLAVRDCARQSAVDLFALVRAIRQTNGLGLKLDPAKLSYVGQSFGATYGSLFHAIEPKVAKAVLNGGGTSVDVSRLSPSGRALATFYLGTRNPPLLNVPPAPQQAYFHDAFNDAYVFRNSPVYVNDVPGALPIQGAFEVAEWLGMLGDPLSYASHFKKSPLPGVPAKTTLFQFGLGDLEVPNPTESAIVRAADGLASCWFFRFDLAAQLHPELLGQMMPGFPLPILPHRFLSNPVIFDLPAATSLALASQQQIASYVNGQANPDPNQFLTGVFSGVNLFEVPAVLPERLNFIQIQP